MNHPDEAPMWQEINRLHEQLDYANERHAAALKNIRERITALEAKLSESTTTDAVESPPAPPPIPIAKAAAPIPRPMPKELNLVVKAKPVAEDEAEENPLTPDPSPHQEGSFELDFGKVWFVRIGIVILLTGLVFLGNYAYQNWIREMSNGVRLTALFACAIGLVEGGRRLAAKENLSRFGEVLLAGGMAFFYYCTFAAHHVGRLKVIDSPVLAALLLFGAAGAIAAVSWLRQAKATAALGFVLAAYSTMLQPIGWMSCVSNILLGAMGLFFMLKPGWSGPGWASMLGSYGAFFGWQVLGAMGKTMRSDDPATLWFLPPLWIMFAIPGVWGRFRESLSDRARSWFTAANNALFFLLFSGVWINFHSHEAYWKVPAIFGGALIALGIIGRKQSTTAGGVNISQGLGIATFAIILKLDGQNLALVLAFESLALAIASWKFRGKSEAVFSLLAGIGSTGLVLYHGANGVLSTGNQNFPIWSTALIAFLLLAASRMAMRSHIPHQPFIRFLRASASLLFVCATIITTHLCIYRLHETPGLLTAMILALSLTIAALTFDQERKQPELEIGSIWFLFIAHILAFQTESTIPLVIAAIVSLAACWLWHRPTEESVSDDEIPSLSARSFSIPAWAFSLAAPIFTYMALHNTGSGHVQMLSFQEAAALLLAIFAVCFRCKRLLATSAAMALCCLGIALFGKSLGDTYLFVSAFIALLPALLINAQWSRARLDEVYRVASSLIFRTTAFIAYCTAWFRFSPDNWSDWLALSSIVLTLLALFLKRKLLAESVALICVGLIAFLHATATSPWHIAPEETGWRGITVVIALLSLVLTYRQRPALIADPARRARSIAMIAGLTCVITTIWATQMLVWRFGWKPAAVLWTVLGFFYVTAGLWQRLHGLRVSGFILLIISFIKLFAIDVWDFTAFMRVVSFIVLGAVLILLGLFYNKFADVIKKLLDDERGLGTKE